MENFICFSISCTMLVIVFTLMVELSCISTVMYLCALMEATVSLSYSWRSILLVVRGDILKSFLRVIGNGFPIVWHHKISYC